MTAFPRLAARFTSIAALGLGSCLARSAAAQPNPFDDYERFMAGQPPPAAPVAPEPALRTTPMTWSLGLGSQLGFSRLTYERGGGTDDASSTALLFRLSPVLGLFVVDRIQIGLSPGLLVRSGGNNGGDNATDANLLIEATAHYFAPLSPRLSFVPGIGLGGYFGSGSRTRTEGTAANGTAIRPEREAKTAGLSLALYLGIAYQLFDHVQLRSGLTANTFFGWDSVERRNASLRNSATHIGIPIELFYTF
jgi:hypothetical protein